MMYSDSERELLTEVMMPLNVMSAVLSSSCTMPESFSKLTVSRLSSMSLPMMLPHAANCGSVLSSSGPLRMANRSVLGAMRRCDSEKSSSLYSFPSISMRKRSERLPSIVSEKFETVVDISVLYFLGDGVVDVVVHVGYEHFGRVL